MIEAKRSLVVGIGSPHGDDQAGWLVIDLLSRLLPRDVSLHKATVPHHLIDWTDGCHVLHVVDACPTNGDLVRIEVRDESCLTLVEQLDRGNSSHHLGIAELLDLGRTLGTLPASVIVWAIPGEHFEPGQQASDRCRQHVNQCAAHIAEELNHA